MTLRQRLPLWFAVPAGVLAAHATAYLLAYPDGAQRSALLQATGHGYFRHAVLVAVLAGAVALTLAVARGARTTWLQAASRVCALQVGAFIAVEVLERVAVGVRPTSGLLRIALIGVAVQVAMGAVVAFVLRVAHRAGRTIIDFARREPKAKRQFVTRMSPVRQTLALPVFAFEGTTRAPPAPPR